MRTRRAIFVLLAVLISLGLVGSSALAGSPDRREVNRTLWVANRGADSIRGFDSATGDVVATIPMRTSSQPGDLAYAKGKLYVAEEFGNLIAFGEFGTNKVGIIDTHTDTLGGEWPASTNPAACSHAGLFSHDGHIVYVANDIVNELSGSAALAPAGAGSGTTVSQKLARVRSPFRLVQL
jgi:DNA-binding beta-propeller fold protein YncE